jgi:hypothetical protein
MAGLLVVAAAAAVTLRRSAPAAKNPRDAVSTPTAAGAPQAGSPLDAGTRTAFEQFRAERGNAPAGQWSVLTVPALSPGKLGLWDDFRVGSPVVMKDPATSQYRMWYVGCRLEGPVHDCGVGHATSADGIAWKRLDEPVFVAPDAPATHWMSALAIAKRGDGYSMWYSIDGDPFADKPRATLHLATSADGISWQHVAKVHTTSHDRTRAIKHTVADDGHLFHLWYFDRPGDNDDESLVHLTSPDGKAWSEAGGDTFDGRTGSIGRPWVTADGRGGFRALLVDYRASAALRWLTSADGTSWTASEVERLRVVGDGVSIAAAASLQTPEGQWLWTTIAPPDRRSAESIGVAFKKGNKS